MILHEVLVSENRYNFIVQVDASTITIGKRGNVDFFKRCLTDTDALSAYIESIESSLRDHQPLKPFAAVTNGLFVFLLCDALFHDTALTLYSERYIQIANTSGAFADCFGLSISPKCRKTKLFSSIMEFVNSYKDNAETVVSLNIASDEEYRVCEISIDNNVITYDINGKLWSACLSGHSDLRNAQCVLSFLHDLKSAIIDQDPIRVHEAISPFGALAAMKLMQCFFDRETKRFFKELTVIIVEKNRTPLKPAKLLREYLGSNRTTYYLEVLSILEAQIPTLVSYLIETNDDVIENDSDVWSLYESKPGSVAPHKIVFDCSEGIREEAQAFLRIKAFPYLIAGRDYTFLIYTIWNSINTGLRILKHLNLTSVMELKKSDVDYLQAYLAQKTDKKLSTQRRILVQLKSFYSFTAIRTHATSANAFSSVKIPLEQANPTEPASPTALKTIDDFLDELEEVIKFAFLFCCITAARANSICSLTTDCLIMRPDGHYVLKVQNHKTELRDTIAGRPPYTYHTLPANIATALLDFIDRTADLRAQMDKPYIFVYRPHRQREGSQRLPLVLSSNKFLLDIEKMLAAVVLYDHNGLPLKCSFRSIRAEVGRSMFAQGAEASEVAAKLGNTPAVALAHYNKQYPIDEAKKRNGFYKDTVESNVRQGTIHTYKPKGTSTEMYGDCLSTVHCSNDRDCRHCSQRITCLSAMQSP